MITQKGLILTLSRYQISNMKEGRNLILFVREVMFSLLEQICTDMAESVADIYVNYEPIYGRSSDLLYELDFLPEHAVNEITYMLREYLQDSVHAFIIAKKKVPDCGTMNFSLSMFQTSRFMIHYEFFQK